MNFREWWAQSPRHLRGITILFGTAAAVFGAITAGSSAWPVIEPALPAHRGHVTSIVNDKAEELQRALRRAETKAVEGRLETIEVRRTMVDKELFEIDIMLRRSTPPLEDQFRGSLELRKRALDDDRKNLDYRLDQLQRSSTSRRP